MLWNSRCCGTSGIHKKKARHVCGGVRMQWNIKGFQKIKKSLSRLLWRPHVVEQRMLWNSRCCGSSGNSKKGSSRVLWRPHVVEQRMNSRCCGTSGDSKKARHVCCGVRML